MSSDARCERLPWDSRFFGFPIARLAPGRLDEPSCQRALAWCSENAVRCLYFLAPPDHPDTLAVVEDHGFRLVDIRVELDCDIEFTGRPAPALRAAGIEDLPRLRELAATGHQVTRFYQDRHFPRESCHELYRTWITESLDAFADVVLVVADESRIMGYVSVRIEDGGVGRIGLIAVDSAGRGRGYGGRLLEGALSYAASRGAGRALVATQARNISALRLYERHGFRVSRVGLWYHRWFEP